MPGIGVRTVAHIRLEVGNASMFATSGHLAAYAGLAPATRRSGSSIRDERPPKGGNKHLKRAFPRRPVRPDQQGLLPAETR